LLYTCGKIGLTLWFLLSLFNLLDELGKMQEIPHTKGRSASGKHHRRIGRDNACPGGWQPTHVLGSIVKGHPIFSPIVAAGEDLKLLAVQGMEGMGDGKKPFH
jgi:hypothetical protein